MALDASVLPKFRVGVVAACEFRARVPVRAVLHLLLAALQREGCRYIFVSRQVGLSVEANKRTVSLKWEHVSNCMDGIMRIMLP